MEEGERLKNKKYKTPLTVFDVVQNQKSEGEIENDKIEDEENNAEKKKGGDEDFLFPISSMF